MSNLAMYDARRAMRTIVQMGARCAWRDAQLRSTA
jgi:hypothetical protein